MSKEQMMRARALILEKRYDEARDILRQIDHPAAPQWLAKLDEIAPPAAQQAAPPEQLALKQQMEAARDLIMQKRYDDARALLSAIDHPAAQTWLAKLDAIVPSAEVLPRDVQEDRLLEAQDLILNSKFDAGQAILDTLTIPESVLWKHKTQMNKFREFQSLWLDMYSYGLVAGPDLDPARWRCGECGRSMKDAQLCPRRGHKPCPVKVRERAIQEPNRLALVIGSIYMGETANIKTMLKDASAERLAHWRSELEWQLGRLWEKDLRRPALETAIMLLAQLEQSRRIQG